MTYPINESTKELAQLKLKAQLHNEQTAVELLQWLAETLPKYTGQFNKRFETWLNKELSAKYGTWKYQDKHPGEVWRYDDPNPEFQNYTAWFRPNTYSMSKSYELTVNFRDGQKVDREWDSKIYTLQPTQESVKFYSVQAVNDIVENIANYHTSKLNTIEKLKQNLKNLNSLVTKHNKLAKELDAYNDAISYAISDEFRIK
jgi:hypothetical protein